MSYPVPSVQPGRAAELDIAVSFRAQRICAWCGPLLLLFTGPGFVVIAGFIPPTPPSDTAQQVADRFLNDRNSIRGGLLLAMFGSTLLCPWYAITGLLLKRIAGRHTPWSATYLMGEVPLMPRWAGYLSLLSATSLIPPTLLVFFKTGPFAWNGIAFYISLACYTTWIFALSGAMVKAINRLEREEVAAQSNGVAVADTVDVAAELAILRQQIKDLQEQRAGSPLPS